MTQKLRNLRIASPCPMLWENLVGDERIRFCSHCKRRVHNLSSMSREQAERLLESQPDLCALVKYGQDGRVITTERRLPYWSAVVRLGLGSMTAGLAVLGTLVGLAIGQDKNCPPSPDSQWAGDHEEMPPMRGGTMLGRVASYSDSEAVQSPVPTPTSGPLPAGKLRR